MGNAKQAGELMTPAQVSVSDKYAAMRKVKTTDDSAHFWKIDVASGKRMTVQVYGEKSLQDYRSNELWTEMDTTMKTEVADFNKSKALNKAKDELDEKLTAKEKENKERRERIKQAKIEEEILVEEERKLKISNTQKENSLKESQAKQADLDKKKAIKSASSAGGAASKKSSVRKKRRKN